MDDGGGARALRGRVPVQQRSSSASGSSGPKAAGVTRVVLLGDSFTEGQGVKEADTTARRLEALLNASGERRWEVLNCARRGADFPSLYKMFEKVLPYDPDVVVHAMVLNDAERPTEFEARRGPLDDWILDRRRLLAGDGARPSARDLLAAGRVRGRSRADLAHRP